MDQLFIFLNYHFLDCFEKLACTLLCYTFLTPLFHICNTSFTSFYLLHPVTPSLHCCNSYHYNFDALLFCGILSGFCFVAFCPCLICGILSCGILSGIPICIMHKYFDLISLPLSYLNFPHLSFFCVGLGIYSTISSCAGCNIFSYGKILQKYF